MSVGRMRKKTFRYSDAVFWLLAAACAISVAYILFVKEIGIGSSLAVAGLSFGAILTLVLARRLSDDAKLTFARVLLALGAAVYTGEIIFTFNLDLGSEQALSIGDRRTMREVIDDLRKNGDSGAVPIIYPSLTVIRPDLFSGVNMSIGDKEVLPLSAISLRTTVLCNESGYWATYTSDEKGFNNPEGVWQSAVRVAVVGDSFSHGNCVHAGEGWVSQIRKRIPQTLNLAMGGNGPAVRVGDNKGIFDRSAASARNLGIP